MLTPLANPQTPAERLYNETRNVVERTFGVWKRRFPCVGSKLRVKLSNLQAVIVSKAMLHNICIDKRDTLPEDSTNPHNMQEIEENIAIGTSTQSDLQYRQQLIDNYFTLLNSN